jgi:hypothetical protein
MSGITEADVKQTLSAHNSRSGPDAGPSVSAKRRSLINQLSTLAVYLPFLFAPVSLNTKPGRDCEGVDLDSPLPCFYCKEDAAKVGPQD